jgi:hypothetical protein
MATVAQVPSPVSIEVARGAAAVPLGPDPLSLLVETALEHDARQAAVTAPTAARVTPPRASRNHVTR